MKKQLLIPLLVISLIVFLFSCKKDPRTATQSPSAVDTTGKDSTLIDSTGTDTTHGDTTEIDTMVDYPNYIIVEGEEFPSEFDTVTKFDSLYFRSVGGNFPEVVLEAEFKSFTAGCYSKLSFFHEDSVIMNSEYGAAQNFNKGKAVGVLFYFPKCMGYLETIRAYPETKNGSYKVTWFHGRRVSEFYKIRLYDPLTKDYFHISGKITWPK